MNKAFIQLFVLLVVFFGLWFGLSRINFVKTFHLDKIAAKTEKKIGDAIIDALHKTDAEVESDTATLVLSQIKNKLLAGNPDMPKDIQLHLISSKEVNAFALPGDHIIVYTGLIKKCDSAEELCGVLSHEMAHLKLNHVMKRLAGEIGIGVLGTITSGNTVVVNKIIKMLSTSAFERQQESDADAEGVKFLTRSHIDPNAFAGFMLKMADMQKDQPGAMEWISTHPDSKKRSETIRQLIDSTRHDYQPVIDVYDWELLKKIAIEES